MHSFLFKCISIRRKKERSWFKEKKIHRFYKVWYRQVAMTPSVHPHPIWSPSCLLGGLYLLASYSKAWNSPGQNTAVCSCCLLQGISQPKDGIQASHSAVVGILLYHLTDQGSPRILEWVACPFSRGSSRPRNWSRVSCISGGFFTSWVTREALQ